MGAKPKEALEIETVWLRDYARTYMPCEAAFSFSADALRRARVSLIDIRHAFRVGRVIHADKLDEPGAIWTVVGDDCDGQALMIIILVVTEMLSVEVRDVRRLDKKEMKNDAA
ncbi:hypothetical protein [Methylobacterium organophilum]|uniref:Uncharacterized protein n=1 Tax=Methylobacterium organophilum TaxID=410 RepID=A0ABQ4T3Q7_METOR|nr:hypothetical protein [Methylobacterium organophilum]GJE26238.1 hypothetical protein LKMONMHP_1087 [Methylobacterium organophilum]